MKLPAVPLGVADFGLGSLRRFIHIEFGVVVGAVVGALASERYGEHIERMTRRRVCEQAG